MIKHKIFSKGDHIHALISTSQQPNVPIPVRCIVYDVKFDDINPQYQIKIIKFYDNIYFLKKNLFGGRFIRNFKGNETKLNLSRKQYPKVEDLETRIFSGDNWEKYLIVVDSVFCTRTKAEQTELFNSLQTFMVQMKLREIFELTNRSVYSKGELFFQTKGVYEKALIKFLGERYPKQKGWIDDLLYMPGVDEMDSTEFM